MSDSVPADVACEFFHVIKSSDLNICPYHCFFQFDFCSIVDISELAGDFLPHSVIFTELFYPSFLEVTLSCE